MPTAILRLETVLPPPGGPIIPSNSGSSERTAGMASYLFMSVCNLGVRDFAARDSRNHDLAEFLIDAFANQRCQNLIVDFGGVLFVGFALGSGRSSDLSFVSGTLALIINGRQSVALCRLSGDLFVALFLFASYLFGTQAHKFGGFHLTFFRCFVHSIQHIQGT